MLYLGADHGGFNAKKELLVWLASKGLETADCGATQLDPGDDYPEFAVAVARHVGMGSEDRGILLCRSGVGMCMAANKVDGVRAVVGFDAQTIIAARADEDSNVLCLAADRLTLQEMQSYIELFLSSPFSSEERHQRRLEKLAAIK